MELVADMSNVEEQGALNMITQYVENCPKVSEESSATEFMKQRNEEIKDEMMEDKSSMTEEDDKLSSVCTNEVKKPYDLVEPKYRFHNRKRHGFMLTMSRRDYLLMTQRKTLKYFDAKSGSFMEVKIANRFNEDLTDKNGVPVQQKLRSMNGGNQPSVDKEMRDNNESIEDYSETHSCVTSDNAQHSSVDSSSCSREGDECSSHIKNDTFFYFSAKPKPTARKKSGTRSKTHGSSSSPAKRNKRRKLQDSKNILSFPTNICGCRFDQGKKRKCVHPIPMDSYHHPRKKEKCSPLPVCTTYLSTKYPGYCIEASYVGTNSIRDLVCPTHEKASDQSNG